MVNKQNSPLFAKINVLVGIIILEKKHFLNRIFGQNKLQKLIKMEDKVKTLTDMGFPLDRV